MWMAPRGPEQPVCDLGNSCSRMPSISFKTLKGALGSKPYLFAAKTRPIITGLLNGQNEACRSMPAAPHSPVSFPQHIGEVGEFRGRCSSAVASVVGTKSAARRASTSPSRVAEPSVPTNCVSQTSVAFADFTCRLPRFDHGFCLPEANVLALWRWLHPRRSEHAVGNLWPMPVSVPSRVLSSCLSVRASARD